MTVPYEPETLSWPVKALPVVVVPVVGAIWVIAVALTVREKLQVPVSPELSESVPEAL